MDRLLTELEADRNPSEQQISQHLARAAGLLGLEGLAVSLVPPAGSIELLFYTGALTAGLEDLQYTQGQGPSMDAITAGRPVLIDDLGDRGTMRWADLLSSVEKIGVRAVFAFPMFLGAARFGVMTGHRTTPGPLGQQQLADGLALASALTGLLTAFAAGAGAAGDFFAMDRDLYHSGVHQASGMVAAQLGISPADALIRIRAHAYQSGHPLAEIATLILTRRLNLAADHPPDHHTP
ncbi:hypothetical protein BIV57_03890 [Mangrovactinospora gilvigrisea]|uniref:ANTAR domain-containing protein n=2 Tax=Mangrovactinospora gilvigrisea TaxID=1428644 RepID=A0A1J7BJA1_9ACTN|nr:hypothetical protein BIV57_03890 [Mangrovactinospora gilvigrisea]